MYVCWVYVCAPFVYIAQEVQKIVSDPLELVLQTIVNFLAGELGTKLESSAWTAHPFNYWAIFTVH